MTNNGEFELIDRIKEMFRVPAGHLGIGDDCAVIPAGEGELLFSTDLLMEGIHFLRSEYAPEDVGWKSAAVNFSDIAAMGGTPVATFLSIALPEDARGEWVERFIDGYAGISRQYDVPLLGGDTSSSLRDIAVNVGVLGRCPSGKRLMRNGARVGDIIYVTGPLGDSAGGLRAILKGIDRTDDVEILINRHKRPVPRVYEGRKLMETGRVGAMMDISDGIASDLRHMMKASGTGAVVALDKIPCSSQLHSICTEQNWDIYELATAGGEDFELLLTGSERLDEHVEFPLHAIGEIVIGDDLIWTVNDKPVIKEFVGYKHF